MPTPTSQAPAANPAVMLAESIAAIARGNPKARELAGLSDLSRSDAKTLAAGWPTFPEATRIGVLHQLDELAETNVAFLFGRAFRIALDDDSAVARQLAIAGLWEDSGNDLIEVFLSMMENDPSADVRAEAATALGRFADLAALDELDVNMALRIERALFNAAKSSAQPDLVRRKALEQLVVFDRAEESEALIQDAYDSDDTAVQASALFAMGRSMDRRWLPTVIAEFENDDAEVRYEAARACGEIGHVDAVQGLSALVLDTDDEVRLAAIISLGKIGGPGAVRVLRALDRSGEAANFDAIEDALAEAQLVAEAPRMQL